MKPSIQDPLRLTQDQRSALALQMLQLLDGLTVEQVRDVIGEAERLANEYAVQVISIAVFHQAVAAPRLGAD